MGIDWRSFWVGCVAGGLAAAVLYLAVLRFMDWVWEKRARQCGEV